MIGQLFQPFVQAERTLDRSRGGLGLGLALARRLVELHGGSVSAASEGPGRGSEFTLRLPLETSAPEPTPSEAPRRVPETARRVLVIEDNVDAAESLREALELGEPIETQGSRRCPGADTETGPTSWIGLVPEGAGRAPAAQRMPHPSDTGGERQRGGSRLLGGAASSTPPRPLLPQNPLLRSAIIAVSAVGLSQLGGRVMGVDHTPLQLTLLPAILVAAIVGGLPGGLLATALCLLAALAWVVHFRPTAQDAMALAMLAVVGALISVLAGLYRAARARLADYERDRVVRETQQEFRAFFENAAVGAAQVDLSGQHVFVNQRYCAITGYTREELASMTPSELSPPGEREAEQEAMGRLMRGELTSREVEKHYLRKDGRRIWVHVTASLIRDDQGRPLRSAVVIADITQRRVAEAALRESELHFHALADHIAQLAWMADERGSIFWCSRRWYDYTGLRAEETRGDGWLRIVHPDERQRVAEVAAAGIAVGEAFESTFRMRGRDGAYSWFLTRVVPVKDDSGRVIRWFGTNTDVTAQRDEQQELEAADRRKNDFLAMLSHELRNPLAPIRNSVYVLERAAPGGAQASARSAVIDRQVQHMTRLVDDLLDVTRIVRGKIRLQRERVELGSVLRRRRRGPPRRASSHARHRARDGAAGRAALRSTATRRASRRSSATCCRTRPSSRPRGGRASGSELRREGLEASLRVARHRQRASAARLLLDGSSSRSCRPSARSTAAGAGSASGWRW